MKDLSSQNSNDDNLVVPVGLDVRLNTDADLSKVDWKTGSYLRSRFLLFPLLMFGKLQL